MEDIAGRILSIIFATMVFIMSIFAVITNASNDIDQHILSETVSFVDQCRTTGFVDAEDYITYCKNIYELGNYEIVLVHEQKAAVWDGTKTDIEYKETYTEKITDYMYGADGTERNPYFMNSGDLVRIQIVKKPSGIRSGMESFLYRTKEQEKIIVNYSGAVQ